MKTFTQKVYENLRKIPEGKVITYKQLGEASGKPKAARAVGNILNKNRDFEKYPCHRVVKSDGSVGRHVLGQKEKIRKLKREDVVIKKNKIVSFNNKLYLFKKGRRKNERME